MNRYFLSVTILLAVYGVVTTTGPKDSEGIPNGPLDRELTHSLVCGETEKLACLQTMSNFADMKAALEKVEISECFKQIMCPTPGEMNSFRETRRKIHENLKNVKEDQSDEAAMKTIGECLSKTGDNKKAEKK